MRRAIMGAALALALLAARSDPLAGYVAGPPAECIDLDRVNGPDIVDGATILYRQSGKRIWKAEPIGTCPSLRPFAIVVADVYGRRLCRNDRFRLLEPGTTIPSGYCRFGAFTPYDKR